MDPVTLETARLLLRPFTPADADAVYAACQDADIQYYTPTPTPFRREDAEKYVVETAPQGWTTDRDYILGAFRTDNGALVGSFCLTKLFQGVYELGYWAAKEQRGLGYSTEAARALCDWGFTVLAAHRIEWWAMAGNTASRALAEKLGFTLEGTLRNRSMVNGEPHDWWVGGLLKP
ncbi:MULTISPECIES: GNAT family N-acetyltransferase [Streptomyces]|uniref:N-acetyltransferase n=1 Tax=Streptomyces dengpaensis TaxID=2049881 RepID=A0ABN5I778_9ACTN|nr:MULTISPECIES: GNAT family protein [Streptomyces]AVH58977.1 N-acetyltransferase [Streptomyces dengpaensis]PIB05904.1 GNAT family N-acetyltransferase [Streptomyces sp. HG99]